MMPLTGIRILVPIDGSVAAEHALIPAAQIARATGGMILLVRVVPLRMWSTGWPGTSIPKDVYERLLENEDQVTRDYLARITYDLGVHGIAAQTYTDRGEVTSSLLSIESRFHVGLVVMTTHGRTGTARLALGSVADHMVRHGTVPVLLVRPFSLDSDECALESALVPLDGSSVSETALEAVQLLAGTLVHHVMLMRVLNASGNESAHIEARNYLEALRLKLMERLDRCQCDVRAKVVRGEPAHNILVHASRACDLVIMATHAETGIRRWTDGSIADRVLHETPVPLLLVHP